MLSSHSDLPWYKVFYRAMDKISDLKLDHQNEVVEPFLYGLREHPIPTPGIDTILSVVPKGVDAGQVGREIEREGEMRGEGERERERKRERERDYTSTSPVGEV